MATGEVLEPCISLKLLSRVTLLYWDDVIAKDLLGLLVERHKQIVVEIVDVERHNEIVDELVECHNKIVDELVAELRILRERGIRHRPVPAASLGTDPDPCNAVVDVEEFRGLPGLPGDGDDSGGDVHDGVPGVRRAPP